MFWIGGLAYNVLGVLVAGATLLVPDATDPAGALDFLERERPEMVNGYAQSIAHLVADPTFASRDFSSIRSGNLYPLMPETLRPRDPELRHNMLGHDRGAAASASPSPTSPTSPSTAAARSAGRCPELEAQVVDRETLAECGTGRAEGELWLRGPNLMEGYYGRERWNTFTPDEWYRTGDLFRRDAEGFFYFGGRADDMIKTGGANVSPREVEAVLARGHRRPLPIVVGVPDAERGAIVGAVLVADRRRRARPRRAARRAARPPLRVQGAAADRAVTRRTSSPRCRAGRPTCAASWRPSVSG